MFDWLWLLGESNTGPVVVVEKFIHVTAYYTLLLDYRLCIAYNMIKY